VTALRGGRSGFYTRHVQEIFLSSEMSRPAVGRTHLRIQWVPGGIFPGREAHHSFPSSAEVKNMWISTYVPSGVDTVGWSGACSRFYCPARPTDTDPYCWPFMEPASKCVLLEPASKCVLLEPASKCVLLKPASKCVLLEPASKCVPLEPASVCQWNPPASVCQWNPPASMSWNPPASVCYWNPSASVCYWNPPASVCY
jgi:hypothetical protein